MQQPVDALGRNLSIGDTITYVVRGSTGLRFRTAVITAINEDAGGYSLSVSATRKAWNRVDTYNTTLTSNKAIVKIEAI